MSLGEMLVVMLVALLVMKPEDIPTIIKKFRALRMYFSNIKNQTLSYIKKELEFDDDLLKDDFEELNFYLQKIINIEGHYDGDYSVPKLKAKYNELIKSKINEFDRDKLQ